MHLSGRVNAVYQWLATRADSRIGRLSMQWFRGYFEASRNSGSAATLYIFLSVVPVVLSGIGLLHAAGVSTNTFAEHLVDHLHLSGTTADLVLNTFGSASSNALAATLAAVVGFLIWGIGIAPLYQDVYARAWQIEVRARSDQARFAIWFFVFTGVNTVVIVSSEGLRTIGWVALVPVWIAGSIAFWLWTPGYLLHRQIAVRRLLPGALLAAVVIGGATATSPLFLGGWITTDAKYFGSFGVVLGLLGWGFVLVTISFVCAVFAPVWERWLESERARNRAPAVEGVDVPGSVG
jgi:uncharacterized BrkB/YihY/UPF0761 family membrane protein